MAGQSKELNPLSLVRGGPAYGNALVDSLHFVLTCLPFFCVGLPLKLISEFILLRWRSPVVQVVGRRWYAHGLLAFTRFYMRVSTGRLLFNGDGYAMIHASPFFGGKRDWVSKVDVKGTRGHWIAPPNTVRAEDDIVLYFLHGGAFILDTGGSCQIYFLALAKRLAALGLQASIFCLDYQLAPEYKYPSQLIESLAGYQYLVNDLGIPASKICMSGDSAGGNLAAALLLHLARPNSAIKTPESLGPVPGQPGSSLLISPFTSLTSSAPSREANGAFDTVDAHWATRGVDAYIGAPVTGAVWNPFSILFGSLPTKIDVTNAKDRTSTGLKDGLGRELLNSPFVNPIVQRDTAWWKEALPGGGRTLITAGGKEILYDDIVELIDVLKESGVAPRTLIKPLGFHDWVLFDAVFPGIFATKVSTKVKEGRQDWGVIAVADFLFDMSGKKKGEVVGAAGTKL